MAYKIGESKAMIEAQLAAIPEMEGLEGNGAVAVSRVQLWDYMKDAIDFASVELSKKYDEMLAAVETLLSTASAGTALQIAALAKAYQHGDTLTNVNNQLVYDLIDESKQVVNYVSIGVEDETTQGIKERIVKIKVAKDNNGAIEQLTEDERIGLVDYFDDAGFFGIFLDVITLEADKIAYELTVEVNPKVIDKDTGAYLDGSSETPILDAIKDYHDTKNKTDFDGKIYKTKPESAVQNIDGIEYAEIDKAMYWNGSQWIEFPRFWQSNAGYVQVSEEDCIIHYL